VRDDIFSIATPTADDLPTIPAARQPHWIDLHAV
jgi:hypothetical protein